MKRITLLFLFPLLCSNAAFAQEDNSRDDVDNVYKENYNLKEELEKKNKKIEELTKEIEKLTNEKKKKPSKDKKEEGKKDLERKVAELRDTIAMLRAGNDEDVKEQYAKDSLQIAQLLAQQAKDKEEIERLSQELSSLNNFKGLWLLQLAESVDSEWMDKAYSQINPEKLEKDLSQFKEFAGSDEKVNNAYQKLQRLYDEYRVYAEGLKCVQSPYDGQKVSQAQSKVKNLMNKQSGDKQNDLNTVSKMLGDYKVNLEIFQDLLTAVNTAIEGQSTSKTAFPLAKVTIDEMEKDGESITCIKTIPWLKEQYEIYYKGLEDNCLKIKENPAYQAIKAIQL